MMPYAVIFALLLGVCIFVGLPRARQWQQVTSVLTFFALIGIVYAGSIDLLGAPKPIRLEWRSTDETTVLAANMREGKAIYVWLKARDGTAPRAYALPWNVKFAQQLQDAMQKHESSGDTVRMSTRSETGREAQEPRFYAEPQRPGPEKSRLRDDVVQFRHPDR